MTRPSAPWFIYALGGGFGHLTRACALARAALVRTRVRILTNSPYADCVRLAMPELDLVTLDPGMTVAAGRMEAVRQIQSAAPDCLIVDTFPRGLGGELVDVVSSFSGPKVFVQRDLNPQYAAAYDLTVFIRNSYHLVLVPGDATADASGPFPQAATTQPWLIRSWTDVLSRDDSRKLLGLHENKPCVMVCAAGNSDELAWYGAVVQGLLESASSCDVRCIAPFCPAGCPAEYWLPYWPALDLYSAADLVIGSAGYNTVYECRACGVPLVAKPWPRKYDRQSLRANRATAVVDHPEQAVAAAVAILGGVPVNGRGKQFHNGVTEAVALIEQLQPMRRRDITST